MDHFYGIYGVGAVIIIVSSQYFNRNNFTLFLGGYLIGSVTEYIISFLVEIVLQTKWWDYSNNILNMNGRICLLYSIFWGILTIFLIRTFHPFVDRIIEKAKDNISQKTGKVVLRNRLNIMRLSSKILLMIFSKSSKISSIFFNY